MNAKYPQNLFHKLGFKEEKITKDKKKGLSYVLGKLPERERTVIMLRYVHEYTYADIATEISASYNWARKVEQSAIKRILSQKYIGFLEMGYQEYLDWLEQQRKTAPELLPVEAVLEIPDRMAINLRRNKINTIGDAQRALKSATHIKGIGQSTQQALHQALKREGYN